MILGAITSSNKKKKEAAQKAEREDQKTVAEIVTTRRKKSLGEILEELAQQEFYIERPKEPEAEPSTPDYFEERMAKQAAEEESAAARLAAMTYQPMRPDSVERNTKKIVDESVMPTEKEFDEPAEEGSIEAILANFDLRRAVIESEILTPKYQQY
jgi:hypothetical protein